jgi:sensor histidine kinase YesM
VTDIPKDWLGDSNSGVVSKTIGNEPVQFVYRKSDFTGWITVGVFPMQETADDISKIRFYLVCFIFFVCMVGLGLSYYLSFTITQPIWKLMALMQKVETGNLSIRYTGHHDDEVGILGRAFNVMLGRIHQLIKEVASKEQQKREAELRNLHAQIKPHFLYNTLDTIHWLAHQRGANEITEVVDSLSTLFRIGLSKGKEIIPLHQEIEHVRSYLKIQKTRYQSKLDYSIDTARETEGLYVMKLIVQPIVENALYHGIKERRGPGSIRITSEVQGGKLLLHIRDDGKGMEPSVLAELRNNLEAVKQTIARQAEGQAEGQANGQVDGQADGQVNGQVDGQTDRQADGQTDVQVDGQTDGQVGGQTDVQVDGQDDGQAGGQTDGQVDGQTDGQVDGQVDGQAEEQAKRLLGAQTTAHVQLAGHAPAESGGFPAPRSGGYGLLNVQSRLVLSYGAAYGLSIDSEPGRGTLVTIIHPFMKEAHREVAAGDESLEGHTGG